MRRRFRAAYLAAVAWLRKCSNKGPNDPKQQRPDRENKDASSNHGTEPTPDMLRAEWAVIQAALGEIYKSEEEHQAAERDIWAAQLRTSHCLNRITAIGAIVGIIGSAVSSFL